MKLKTLAMALSAALAGIVSVPAALAAAPDIVIGDIDDLSGNYADVAGTGAVEPPGRTGGGQSIAIGRRQPFWHCGQRSDELVCGDRVTGKSMLTLGESASSRVRHNWILAVRPRLARKPKWRIFTKPRGSTWSRKRRMNSAAGSVMVVGWPACV